MRFFYIYVGVTRPSSVVASLPSGAFAFLLLQEHPFPAPKNRWVVASASGASPFLLLQEHPLPAPCWRGADDRPANHRRRKAGR